MILEDEKILHACALVRITVVETDYQKSFTDSMQYQSKSQILGHSS